MYKRQVLRNKNAVIISADTIVTLDGQILGKPKDEDDAFNTVSYTHLDVYKRQVLNVQKMQVLRLK